MAYKEESQQQFMESIVNQARGPVRRPMGSQQYNGDPGNGPDDDSFGNERSPMKLRSGGFQNLDGADQYDNDQAVTNFTNSISVRDEEENPHMEMSHLKKLIKDKERELHELQQQKVKLMRKITGRLECTNNKIFKPWNEEQISANKQQAPASYIVYCSQCGEEFRNNVKSGFSHCKDHKSVK